MIDDDAVASLTRFDTMLRDISDKWKGLTVRVRVAFVRTLTGGEDTSADGADAVKWMQMQMEAAAKVFPDKFTWDPRTRSATGSMGSLSDAERLRVTAEASRALRAELDAQADAAGKASKAVRDAADNQDKAAQATARFEAQLASLNERLASREMSTAQVDTLAEAFNRGKESVRSLLETLNTADAVTRVVDRARFMTAMVAEYGQAWRGADMLTREHTDHLQKTEDKMRAVRTEMEKLLQATKEETKALEAASEKFRPGVRIPMEPSGPVPETAMGAPQGGRVPAKVWEWLGGQNEDSAAGAMIAAMQKIGGAVDSAVDRWTAKMVVFRGFFGEIMRAIVAEAIRAFARMAAIRIFEKVLEIAGGGGGGGDAISQIKQGVKSGNAIPLTSFGSPAQGRQSGDSASLASSGDGRVPRGTNTTIVNVSALDLGTVVDRIRSPFGALRMALEDAQDAGRA
jgi:exonuclease VII small subunit